MLVNAFCTALLNSEGRANLNPGIYEYLKKPKELLNTSANGIR
jgi:hypothetical protein